MADLTANKGKVVEMNDGQILFDSESSLTVNDGYVIEINGGEVTFNENSDLSTNYGNGISIVGGTINYNSGRHYVFTSGGGAAIKLDNGTINAHNDTSYLSVTSRDTSNALEIHGGKASLGESMMYAISSGNAISMSGSELILNSETNIYADDGTGILLSGGSITVGKDLEVYMDLDNIPIDITGGENDAIAAIESSVTSGNTAVFNNTGKITGDNFKDIIVHNGTGTLKVNNTSTGILANNKGNLMATTSTGTIEVSNSAKLTGTMDAGTKGTINLNNNVSGIWESTGNSKLSNVTNAGLIQFMHPISGRDPDKFHTLNITGNYKGENGTVKMHTVWNEPLSDTIGENFKSDILKIDGSASGITTIIPVSTVDGTENIIDGDIKQVDTILNSGSVVYVGKKGADVAFKGKAKTTGASEVQIKKRSSTEGDEYYWTTDLSEEDGRVPIYANVVAGYTLMPRVNIEQGFTSIANLAERRSDVCCEDCSNDKNHYTWARTFGKNQKQDGKQRLNLDTDIYGFQVGHDFSVKQFDDNSKNLLGAYISYSRANTDFSDQYHADNGIISKDKRTGKGTSDNISLGLTNTYLSGSGRYLDLVGQLSYLHNKYTARNSDNPDSQDGWGVALSAEIGQFVPFSSSDWALEPQAQLVYQYLNLDSFTDGIRYINQNNQDGLRGRIGLKLSYNPTSKAGQRKSVYAISNIWHDFIKPDSVNIGHDRIHENFNSTWGGIGVGIQLLLAQNSKIYGDIRYEYDFGGSKNQSFNGNIGFKLNW